ncbi:hypothetical protein HPB47_017118 [Ixodes persulcatus]|uniref:Uncharacterized protein n=1 Tax=Ixodes persulcatus TaxID=34615 RepID=A0AC60QSU6_IXOPE|nr:hypothetical protein HPB47_017118 [Ixodes persulcatus]
MSAIGRAGRALRFEQRITGSGAPAYGTSPSDSLYSSIWSSTSLSSPLQQPVAMLIACRKHVVTRSRGPDGHHGAHVLSKSNAPSSNTTPFNKEELAAILKFGAEELFKETEDGDEEPQVDIDEILQRAETREEQPTTVGDELLGSFKVASFNFTEEEEVGAAVAGAEEDSSSQSKDWDDIIPEAERKKVEDEEKLKEEMELYLPPRSRKSVHQTANSDSEDGGRSARRRDRDRGSGGGSNGSDDEGRPRKRGRPRVIPRDTVKGFTDAEIRRFIKSYRKFAAPAKRLDAVALDAELQEKPQADLKRLAHLLHSGCEQAMKESQAAPLPGGADAGDSNGGGTPARRRHQRTTFKLSGVSVNAKSVLSSYQELAVLDAVLPSTAEERRHWTLDLATKDPHFDTPWGVAEDSSLLRGIYEHGMGSWEAIKMDAGLGLTDKILPDGEQLKPQTKHLQSRADYLLKMLRKVHARQVALQEGKEKPKRGRKTRPEKVHLSKAIVDNDDSNDSDNASSTKLPRKPKVKVEDETHQSNAVAVIDGVAKGVTPGGPNIPEVKPGVEGGPPKAKRKKKDKDKDKAKDKTKAKDKEKDKDKDKEEKKKKKKKHETPAEGGAVSKTKGARKDLPAMHYTANAAPQVIEPTGDLDLQLFNECKEKMRPVKRALKQLDTPDSSLNDDEQVNHTRLCLLKIGEHINECCAEYTDPEKSKQWRSNLWSFVAKFTELDAKALHRLYRHAQKKNEGGDKPDKSRESDKRDHDKRPKLHDERHAEDDHGRPSKRLHEDKGRDRRNENSSNSHGKGMSGGGSYRDRGSSNSYQKSSSSGNSYSNPPHRTSSSNDHRWNHETPSPNWDYKDRYNNDYNKHDAYRHYGGSGRGDEQRYHAGTGSTGNFSYGIPASVPGGYGGYGATASVPSAASLQPPPPGVLGEHSPMGPYSPYQGHGDSWRRKERSNSGSYGRPPSHYDRPSDAPQKHA